MSVEYIFITMKFPGPNRIKVDEFLNKNGFHVDSNGFRRRGIFITKQLRPGQKTGAVLYTDEVLSITIATDAYCQTAVEMAERIQKEFFVHDTNIPDRIKSTIEQANKKKEKAPDSFEAYDCPMCGTEFGVFYVKNKGYRCSHCDKKAPVPDNPEVLKCVCGETYYLRPYNIEYLKDDVLCERCGHPLFGEESEAYYLDAYGNHC